MTFKWIPFFFLFACVAKDLPPAAPLPEGEVPLEAQPNLVLRPELESPVAPALPPGGKLYQIPQGEHRSSGLPDFKFIPRRMVLWQVMFSKETAYQTKNPINQFDINKLVGFSDCFSVHHHMNSARFGWNWDLEKKVIKLWAYTYVDKQRQYAFIKDVPQEKVLSLSLQLQGNQYLFFADGVEVRMPRGCSSHWAWGYRLYPYFGGDETAPHSMSIWLKQI